MSRFTRTENVVLIGPMGAGKSTVGRRLADGLGWRFVDLDEVIERRSGRSVAEIFDGPGELAFRVIEREAALEVMAGTDTVLATGGGWAVESGSLESLRPNTLSVWLKASAPETVRRVREDVTVRPLLNPKRWDTNAMDMLEVAGSLAQDRNDRYSLADLHLDTERYDPDRLAHMILKRIETRELNS